MKIDHTGLSGVSPERTDNSGQAKAESQTAEKHTREQSDQVQLSTLSETVRLLANEPPERTAKIEQLAKAVAAGTYNVDPVEVGKRIIADTLETPPPGRSE